MSLVETLTVRFEQNTNRHPRISWNDVAVALKSKKLLSVVQRMEDSGGEPDVVVLPGVDSPAFVDCSVQSPPGRRSLCYDAAAHASRKQNKPSSSAELVAKQLGITMLNEKQYRALQKLGEFDTTTSSWIATPSDVRDLGGALFCDRRFGMVFTYHNGAESYYAARGFRGYIEIG